MVQVFADGSLIYDPHLDGYELLELTAEVGAEKGGTAEIVMPPGHPAYDAFVSYRTIVEIYRANELVFRGRALYTTDDFDNIRTITCEGERCFLRDAVMQPYLYQADPAAIFADVLRQYNAQVEPFKRFRVGAITVKDSNDYQYIECESASQVSDVIDKLVEYVGGYIVFSSDASGQRVINWYSSLDKVSGQTIEFGENLLDFSRSGANTDLATVIYPYGAKDETTGKRVNISAVNDGKLYIKDDEAVAKYGVIAEPLFWDNVTRADNLLRKARQELNNRKRPVTTLELSAVDLSYQGVSIDALRVGDNVHVLSAPHNVDDLFFLSTRSYDFLDPSQDKIVLGKDVTTLTSSTASSVKSISAKLNASEQSVTNTYNIYSSGSSGSSDTTDWLNKVYPVGSIYMSVNATSPETLFGGKWETIEGSFLYAAGGGIKAGAKGGEASHTLTVSEMPEHAHYTPYVVSWGSESNLDAWESYWVEGTMGDSGSSGYKGKWHPYYTQTEGSGAAHNNMPPYLAVYMWKRTS